VALVPLSEEEAVYQGPLGMPQLDAYQMPIENDRLGKSGHLIFMASTRFTNLVRTAQAEGVRHDTPNATFHQHG